MNIPKKVQERIVSGLKKFQPLLISAKSRDVGEADTVTLIKDMLDEVFGYDKYEDITSEHAIRGTYCDLAIKIDGQLSLLIEVKAIGIDLKDQHIKQAVDYAANQGLDWVILTNGLDWMVFNVLFTKPIQHELVLRTSIDSLSHRNIKDLQTLFLLCKEGWKKSALGDFKRQKQALSKYLVAAITASEVVTDVIKRELRRVSPDAKIDSDALKKVLLEQVLKREVIEGDEAADAKKIVSKASNRVLKKRTTTQMESVERDMSTGDAPTQSGSP